MAEQVDPEVNLAELHGRVEAAIRAAEAYDLDRVLRAHESAAETRTRSEELRAQAVAVRTERTHYHNLLKELRDLVENLQRALESRAGIEQAKGIIMAVEHCSADEAFDRLRVISQRTNRKLVAVATEVVERAQRHAEPPNPSNPPN